MALQHDGLSPEPRQARGFLPERFTLSACSFGAVITQSLPLPSFAYIKAKIGHNKNDMYDKERVRCPKFQKIIIRLYNTIFHLMEQSLTIYKGGDKNDKNN